LYQPRRAAATHRLRVDLNSGGGHTGADQRGGDVLGAREAELEGGGLGVGAGIRGIAVAGHGDQGIAAPSGQRVQRRDG